MASNKVSHLVVRAASGIWPWQTNDVDVLHFTQRTVVDNGVKKVMPTSVSFNDAVTSTTQTVYMRFRWDGCVDADVTAALWMLVNGYNWNDHVGYGVGLHYVGSSNKKEAGLAVMVPTKSTQTWTYKVSTNKWYDLFTTFSPCVTNADQTTVRFALISPAASGKTPTLARQELLLAQKLAFSTTRPNLTIGGEASSTQYITTTGNSNYGCKCFRGDIARTMIWTRALSENEMWQVAMDASGVDWKLGADDGSADEFAALDAADATWLVTNGWYNVRRELTEAKPTWTVKCPIPSREAGKDKILEIRPILSGGSSFPVVVSVNGTAVGTYDLACDIERAIPIKGKFWKTGSDGLATITVSRQEPFVGTLALDSMALCGGWRMSGTMSAEGTVKPFAFVGLTDPLKFQRATNVLPDGWNGTPLSPFVSVTAYIPSAAVATHDYTLAVKVNGRADASYALPHALLVNGQEVLQTDDIAANQILTCQIPKNLLVAGQNVFTVTNKAEIVTGKSRWVSYSYYDISVKGHLRGFCIIFR